MSFSKIALHIHPPVKRPLLAEDVNHFMGLHWHLVGQQEGYTTTLVPHEVIPKPRGVAMYQVISKLGITKHQDGGMVVPR